ncbi:hypothetical protein CRUP_024627 [Coryphaenoides rupestris]|nr:hypothetical protein CRUP_024627 [Coryphaenoides rupestris]
MNQLGGGGGGSVNQLGGGGGSVNQFGGGGGSVNQLGGGGGGSVNQLGGGGGSMNQLGGTFLNGRPLPPSKRREIIQLASEGVRPSDISKMIRILSRFQATGRMEPKAIGGSRPRLLTSAVAMAIVRCKRENPTVFAWEIRGKLAARGVCSPSHLPSVHWTGGEAGEQESTGDQWKRKDRSVTHNRTTYTPEQSYALEQEFSQSHYADMYTREKLSARIHLPEDKIKDSDMPTRTCPDSLRVQVRRRRRRAVVVAAARGGRSSSTSSSTSSSRRPTATSKPTGCMLYQRKKREEEGRRVLEQAKGSTTQGKPGDPCGVCREPRRRESGHAFYNGEFYCPTEQGRSVLLH